MKAFPNRQTDGRWWVSVISGACSYLGVWDAVSKCIHYFLPNTKTTTTLMTAWAQGWHFLKPQNPVFPGSHNGYTHLFWLTLFFSLSFPFLPWRRTKASFWPRWALERDCLNSFWWNSGGPTDDVQVKRNSRFVSSRHLYPDLNLFYPAPCFQGIIKVIFWILMLWKYYKYNKCSLPCGKKNPLHFKSW